MDEKKIKQISTIGPRAAIGLHMLELASSNKNLIVLTSDVSSSAGLSRFTKKFENQYIDVGIAEQNLIGVAAGLASEGFDVVTTTFAPFQTIRCCEQIRVNLGYMKIKVVMIGLASGLVLGPLGFTHCCIEDIAMMKSIPNLCVVSPADSFETLKAIEAALEYPSSVYIRITGGSNNPIIYEKDYNFEIGKPIKIREGNDICIFANGAILNEALGAASILEKENIQCTVVNVHTLKPLNERYFEEYFSNKKLLVSIEEHNVIGGLGTSISDLMSNSSRSTANLLKIGINDNYDFHGDYNHLKVKYKLTASQIAETILKQLNKS
jgi:transketolase